MPNLLPISNFLLKPNEIESFKVLMEEIYGFVKKEIIDNPLMMNYLDNISILLVGSTSLGVIDQNSDIDVQIFCDDDVYSFIDQNYVKEGLVPENSQFFVNFKLNSGKVGHYTLHRLSILHDGLKNGSMEHIWAAASSYILHDGINLKALFKEYYPIESQLLHNMQKKSYIKIRNYAKSLDNPVNRGDHFSILFFATDMFREILRCSLLIEGFPFPYDKWLVPVADLSTVGKKVLLEADSFFRYIQEGKTYLPMFQEDNPLVKFEKRIRIILVESFREQGINEPWLVEWWKYVEK